MAPLRFITGGESHGRGLSVILDGMPAHVPLTAADINRDLHRRQQGYGRGGRMRIEQDEAEIWSGVRHGLTMGSPVSLLIRNRDWANWQQAMAAEPLPTEALGDRAGSEAGEASSEAAEPGWRLEPVTRPRPGHADLPGHLKYGHTDIRNVLERASARETTARTAAGAVAKALLRALGIGVYGYVVRIGDVAVPETWSGRAEHPGRLAKRAEDSPVRCPDPALDEAMVAAIKQAGQQGDTLGGVFEVVATGVPAGLGAFSLWDRRLDGHLAQAVMGINAVKGVEIGEGFTAASSLGSAAHDAIYYEAPQTLDLPAPLQGPDDIGAVRGPAGGYYRRTNRAGGLEAGISNGEPVVVRAAMKPIATLRQALDSVDIASKEAFAAHHERSDICAVPAAAVIGEAVVALTLASALLDKFGGDSLGEMRRNYRGYILQMAGEQP